MSKPNDAVSIIRLHNSKKPVPAINLVKTNPHLAAYSSKLVKGFVDPEYSSDGKRKPRIPFNNNFNQISNQISEKIIDIENIKDLFPETKIAELIIVSSILSPQDMGQNKLNFELTNDFNSSDIANMIIVEIKNYFNKIYNINKEMPDIIKKCLFDTGSCPKIVLPENSLDSLINQDYNYSQEAFKPLFKENNIKNLGFLINKDQNNKNKNSISFENFKMNSLNSLEYKTAIEFDKNIHFIDNFNILKIPLIEKNKSSLESRKIINSQKRNNVLNFESINLTDRELFQLFFKPTKANSKDIVKLKRSDEIARSSVGRPLIITAPSESIIPIVRPNNEEDPVCYIGLLDSSGNFINKTSEQNNFNKMKNDIGFFKQNQTSLVSELTSRARNQFNLSDRDLVTFDQAADVYSDIIEADILSRIRNGNLGSNISVKESNEIYKVMLARSLRNQTTQLLYIPKELITYFCFEVDKRGIGKSLLDDSRILNSLRAISLVARVMAQIKNAIPRTVVRIKYDEDDPDPSKSGETIMHIHQKNRTGMFPVALNNPGDIIDWARNAGYEYVHENHPGLPDYQIDTSEKQTSYSTPDNELDELLENKFNNNLGLNTEQINAAKGADFASVAEQNHILFKQKIKLWQIKFCEKSTEYVKNICFNDSDLLDILYKFVNENFDKLDASFQEKIKGFEQRKETIIKLLISEIFSNIIITLPEPDSTNISNQLAAIEKYEELVDKAIEHYFGGDIISSNFSGDSLDGSKDTIKANCKALLLRNFIIRKNILPELTDMFKLNEDGIEEIVGFENITSHLNSLSKLMVNMTKQTHRVKAALEKDIEALTNGEGLDSSGGESSYDSSSSGDENSGSSSDDEFGGMDDMGDMETIDDMSGGEESTSDADETKPETPDEETKKPDEKEPKKE